MTEQFIRIIEPIDISDILESYFSLEENIPWTIHGHKSKQIGLQYKKNEDPWASSVGRRKDDEFLYNIVNPFFENTIFEKLIKKYNLYRTRLLWVNPMSCYSFHADYTPRLHIPLITNKNCYFVFKESMETTNAIVQHLPIGNVYWTNTTLPHTFMNCSEQARLHLVGILEK